MRTAIFRGPSQTNKNERERLTLDDMKEFIRKNNSVLGSLNLIDLNSIKNETEVIELNRLKYGEAKPAILSGYDFGDLFGSEIKYIHRGVLNFIPEYNDKNISLYSSVIVCLEPNFLLQPIPEQEKDISDFIKCLKNETSKFNYRRQYGWEKDDLYKSLSKGFIGFNVLKYISDYLHINIFILDLEENKLIYGGGESCIIYKKSIFLIRYNDNFFEPLYTQSSRFFSIEDKVIKNIIKNQNKIGVYKLSDKIDFEFVIKSEELGFYLNIKQEIKKSENPILYDVKDLNKKKLAELQEIATSHDIELVVKKKIKKDDEIIYVDGKRKTKEQLIIELTENTQQENNDS